MFFESTNLVFLLALILLGREVGHISSGTISGSVLSDQSQQCSRDLLQNQGLICD